MKCFLDGVSSFYALHDPVVSRTCRLASPSPQLEERLSSDQLEELLALFRSRHGRGHPRTRGRMSTHEFRAHLARLLGREETDDAIVVLSAKAGVISSASTALATSPPHCTDGW